MGKYRASTAKTKDLNLHKWLIMYNQLKAIMILEITEDLKRKNAVSKSNLLHNFILNILLR